MKELMFGRHAVVMAEAGDNGGEGGAGGGEGDAGGAGDGGALSSVSHADDNGGEGGAGGGEGGGEAIDWDNVTDAEYFAKVAMPEIDGVQINSEFAAKRYGEFCRKHHISPGVVSEFMKMEGEGYAAGLKKMHEASAAKAAETRANFDAQGKALHAKYTPAQISTAIDTLRNSVELSGDADFMKAITGSLSNNKTMVALLLNWAETHKGDGNTGAGSGNGSIGAKGFASTWTGKNYG